jgi:uncharacterized membrane protein
MKLTLKHMVTGVAADYLGLSLNQLLAERFARGEIDEDEYHQRLTSLRAAIPAAP